jgi:hypothetical protein
MARTPQQIGASNRRNGPTRPRTDRTPQQQGARNRGAGKRWEIDCESYLRLKAGFPNATRNLHTGVGDFMGVGDLNLECTIVPWEKVWAKVDQAEEDANAPGGPGDFVVWKKRPRVGDPGRGYAIMTAERFWCLWADLCAYQRAEADFHLDWEKAFAAGFKAAKEGETRDTA